VQQRRNENRISEGPRCSGGIGSSTINGSGVNDPNTPHLVRPSHEAQKCSIVCKTKHVTQKAPQYNLTCKICLRHANKIVEKSKLFAKDCQVWYTEKHVSLAPLAIVKRKREEKGNSIRIVPTRHNAPPWRQRQWLNAWPSAARPKLKDWLWTKSLPKKFES